MPKAQGAWVTIVLGAALGAATFFALGGGHVLNPWHVQWLFDSPDPRTHYLGWAFYRGGAWHWPLGLNPRYGEAMGSSVVYSDSIPLMAMLFKLIAPLLSGPVQYTGVWLLVCMMLQGAGGMLVAQRLGAGWVGRMLCCLILVAPPILLQRMTGHYALVGQWTILWAIWMYLGDPQGAGRRRWWWAGLAVIAALVHLYLAVLVLAVWAADMVRRRVAGWPMLREVAVVVLPVLLAMWMAGYFVLGFGDVKTPGAAGAYSMNLLSPVNPMGMSQFLPALPVQREGQREGSCYLGLGIMVLLLTAAWVAWRRLALRSLRRGPLAIVAGLLAVFAISPVITLGSAVLLKLPNFYGPLLEALRATGRMTWLAWYVLVIAALGVIVGRLGQRQATVVLAGILVVQIADLWPGVAKVRAHFGSDYRWVDPMTDGFWRTAGGRYKHVVLVPAEDPATVQGAGPGLDWFALGKWASDHGMTIDYGYFARYSWNARVKADEQNRAALEAGKLDPETLYILTDDRQYDAIPDSAWVGSVDGLRIIAPGLRK